MRHVVAAPEYPYGRLFPSRPEDLRQHPCVILRGRDNEPERHLVNGEIFRLLSRRSASRPRAASHSSRQVSADRLDRRSRKRYAEKWQTEARFSRALPGRMKMAESVYKVIELIGTSTESWEKAAKAAVEKAAASLRDLRIAEVTEQDIQLKDGKVELYRTKLKVSFKYEGAD